MTPAPAIAVRAAGPAEVRIARTLLPRVFRPGFRPVVFLAWQGDGPVVLGAAAVEPNAGQVVGTWSRGAQRLAVRVPEQYRRQGVGRRLLTAAVDSATDAGATSLISWQPLPQDSAGAAFLLASGFSAVAQRRRFETGFDELYPLVDRLFRRLQERGKVPAEARMARLAEVPGKEVVRFHRRYLGGNVRALQLQLAGRGRRPANPDTPVLLVEGRVAGVLLGNVEDGVARVEAKIVAPGLRGGWANLWLMKTAMDRAVPKGGRRISFEVHGEVTDTLKLARRSRAELVSVSHFYHRPLAAAEPEGA